MLCLFPFEEEFYRQHNLPVAFVGYPLAGQIPMQPDTLNAREKLAMDPQRPLLTIMPGSRSSEVEMMAELFLKVAAKLLQSCPQLQFVIPAANRIAIVNYSRLLRPAAACDLIQQQSLLAMEAADAVLLTSGTTALEAMLLKKPMVVSYRMGNLYKLIKTTDQNTFVRFPIFSPTKC